jgi:hypothetical protein
MYTLREGTSVVSQKFDGEIGRPSLVIPAQAGNQSLLPSAKVEQTWIPASAGMTKTGRRFVNVILQRNAYKHGISNE